MMQVISSYRGVLRTAEAECLTPRPMFATGLDAIDSLLPGGAWSRGAVHELLKRPGSVPCRSLAILLACRAGDISGNIVWCSPQMPYAPALPTWKVAMNRFYLLRTDSAANAIWAANECLRCKAVDATIAEPARLSRVEARRLQLAAERGGGIGILLRTAGASSAHYAAATRWLVQAVPGTRMSQRWSVELVHGHGGQIGKPVILEIDRDTHHVRAFEKLADRPVQAPAVSRVPA